MHVSIDKSKSDVYGVYEFEFESCRVA